jgi:hypothetical protein
MKKGFILEAAVTKERNMVTRLKMQSTDWTLERSIIPARKLFLGENDGNNQG